jgi:hypothetical protein
MSRFVSRLFGRGTAPKSVSVEIPTHVFRRIKEAVARSDTEEGGKFLGRIVDDGRGLRIQIETYIDSGPRANRSKTHIIPDTEYQEALFRVVESLDPEIDLVGSWHSHHCNGLTNLSSGDCQTYLECVNDTRYNSDVFFVLLVVGMNGSTLAAKSFLFVRGQPSGYVLRPKQVRETDHVYPFNNILEAAEHATMQSGNRFAGTAPASAVVIQPTGFTGTAPAGMALSQPNDTVEVTDALKSFRAEDNAWFSNNLPDFKITRARRSGSIVWSGRLTRGTRTLAVRYEHPQGGESPMVASMLIMDGTQAVGSYKIPLDDRRHAEIARLILEAFGTVEGREGRPGSTEGDDQHPAVDNYC